MNEVRHPSTVRYERLSWPEVNGAVEEGRTVLVPVGAIEDHGPHLPLDVDVEIVSAIGEHVADDRDDVLLFPTVRHGYLPHHMDFPGGITIGWESFVNHLIDVCVSLAHHGFRKIVLLNGHGSNHHLVEHVTRQVILQYPTVQCAMLSWWEIEELREAAAEHRTAGPHGTSHAGELETSIYLHLHPDRVDMERAPRDVNYPPSAYFNASDLAGERDPEWSTAVTMMEWWSTFSETGVRGDATVATSEKGERFLAAAVAGLHEVLDAFGEYPHRPIEDHHLREVADEEYDPFRPR